MPVLASAPAPPIPVLLLADPARARELWLAWRESVDVEALDSTTLTQLPLLSDKLPTWTSEDEHGGRLLGICKRAWVQNQLRYREAAELWTLLQAGGAEPVALCGDAAFALHHQKERSVRSIASVEILIKRSHVNEATRALQAACWLLEEGMPQPNGRVLDQFSGVWFRSTEGSAFLLRWRLPEVSPEFAAESEHAPAVAAIDFEGRALQGVVASMLAPEELLLQALSRAEDTSIPWECDAAILLRNCRMDWTRFLRLAQSYPSTRTRCMYLRETFGLQIPASALAAEQPHRFSRLEQWRTDYRQVCWEANSERSLTGFVCYVLQRPLRAASGPSTLSVVDASRNSNALALADYLRFGTLFRFLILRDIQLRYRRTWVGVLWALIQPILPMLIFAAIFARAVRPELPRGPYWLFVLAGLAPWNFFANAVNYAAGTFVANANLLSKVYFPRAILPAAAVAACLVDLCVSGVALVALSWIVKYSPTTRLVLLPLIFCAATLVAGAAGLAAASINALHRDAKPLVTFLVQIAMYTTPVIYPLQMLPARWQWVPWLNPMTAIVESFRFALLATPFPWRGVVISVVSFAVLCVFAFLLFQNVEADIAERV